MRGRIHEKQCRGFVDPISIYYSLLSSVFKNIKSDFDLHVLLFNIFY